MRGWNRRCGERLKSAHWKRNALVGLLMIPAASQFAGCGSDDPTEPQTAVDIAISKTVDDESPTEGTSVTYTVTASNGGPDNATAVRVADSLPAGVAYESNTGQGTYDSSTGVWDVGSIANGASATLTLTVMVDEGTGGTSITNTATLSNVAEGDNNSANDSDSVDIMVQDHMLVLEPIKDNTLFQDPQGDRSNGVGEFLYAGRSAGVDTIPVDGTIRRCLMEFNVRDVPANAVIESVELTLTVSRTPKLDLVNFVIHRVLADWGEGTSNSGGRVEDLGGGFGAPATTGDATWLHRFYDGSFWNNAGGDFEAFEAATVAVSGAGEYTWSGNGLRSDVEDWIANESQNHGWILVGREDVDQTARRFASRENVDGTGPKLKITYALSSPAPPGR